MTAPVPTVLSWSGGKDSALALHELLMDPAVDLRGLLTTVTDGYDRVSMHGVRTSLVAAQAELVLELLGRNQIFEFSATNDVCSLAHDHGCELVGDF